MKQYFILLLIVTFSIASIAQDKNDVPFLTRKFANESIKNVESETSGGSITVMGVSRPGKSGGVYMAKQRQKKWFDF